MNIHIKASLKDLAFRDRCEPVIANTVCINASKEMISGERKEKLYFLTYLKKKKKKEDLKSSSSQV